MNGRMDEQMDKWTRTDGRTIESEDGQIDKRTDRQMEEQMDK